MMLGGITQQRVSQLVRAGELVAERDLDGRLKYDRLAAERYAADRAAMRAANAAAADERRAQQSEARERLARERKRHAAELAARAAMHDALFERAVLALEKLAARPCR